MAIPSREERERLEANLLDALAQHAEVLERHPSVAGIGLGFETSPQYPSGRYVIKVFVRDKPDRAFPKFLKLEVAPDQFLDLPITLESMGQLRADRAAW